ncbi:hypothetical protein ACLQ2S_17035 [Micromonospora sp. DT48]|uniref:hypothetical protein n=1 Tax=Micromonospora sp. DT48 TaxID=3393429 RepID=UPI003CEB81CE
MPVNHAPVTFRPRRPAKVLLALGLLLGLVASTALVSPASARDVTASSADPLCNSSGFSQPPGPLTPIALTWSHIGSRSNSGTTYRYWMVQEVYTSTVVYRNSYVVRCSGTTLLSTTLIPTNGGFGTPYCTSSGDYNPPASSTTARYVGQRTSRESGFIGALTFRYWHREWLSVATLKWVYDSSYVVRC